MNDKILVQWYMVLNERFSGNYKDALAIFSAGLTKPLDTQFAYVPPALQIGELYGLLGKAELARAYSDSARITLEELIRNQPEDARYHSSLGMAYAGLGRKDDAVREGQRGMELLPVSREAWRGARRARDMAKISVMVGNYTQAIEILKMLSSVPSEVSRTSLRIDPVWEPLRGLPEYQNLVQAMVK
jgi:Flp pilus assembly protein TadD